MKRLDVLFVGSVLAMSSAACGAPLADGTGGSGGKAPAATYATSDCGTCAKATCQDWFTTCGSDPGCQAFADCLNACPLASNGDADPACVAACPLGNSSVSTKAIADIQECRTHPAASACAACGAPTKSYQSPFLNQMCPATSTDPTMCGNCEDLHCCETYATAKANPEVKALQSCIQACPKATWLQCNKDCVMQHPNGSDDFGRLFGCISILCLDPCAAPQVPTPDDRCLADTCGDEYMAFIGATGGWAMRACIGACPIDDTVCDSKCYAAYPAAYAQYYAFAECVIVGCG